MHFSQFIRSVRVVGMRAQLLLELLPGRSHVVPRLILPKAAQQASADAIMDSGPIWLQPQHFPIFLNRLTVGALALMSLGGCEMSPNRSRSNLCQLFHGQECEISVHLPSLIQDFGVVGIEPIQLQRHFYGLAVLPERRI